MKTETLYQIAELQEQARKEGILDINKYDEILTVLLTPQAFREAFEDVKTETKRILDGKTFLRIKEVDGIEYRTIIYDYELTEKDREDIAWFGV